MMWPYPPQHLLITTDPCAERFRPLEIDNSHEKAENGAGCSVDGQVGNVGAADAAVHLSALQGDDCFLSAGDQLDRCGRFGGLGIGGEPRGGVGQPRRLEGVIGTFVGHATQTPLPELPQNWFEVCTI